MKEVANIIGDIIKSAQELMNEVSDKKEPLNYSNLDFKLNLGSKNQWRNAFVKKNSVKCVQLDHKAIDFIANHLRELGYSVLVDERKIAIQALKNNTGFNLKEGDWVLQVDKGIRVLSASTFNALFRTAAP